MEPGQWNDDEIFPAAPVPLHERTWRHPSELGSAQWAATEPPLVVGRGLTLASSAIGVVLAIGILWLMIPRQASNGLTAESSVRLVPLTPALVTVGADTTAATEPATTLRLRRTEPATSADDADIIVASVTNTVETIPPAPTVPINAVPPNIETTEVPAFVVAIESGHFVVTTARALHNRQDPMVVFASGRQAQAELVAIDAVANVAVLWLPFMFDEGVFEPGLIDPADTLTVLNNDSRTASITIDDAGVTHLVSDDSLHEGAVIVDSSGQLVGLCTMANDEALLITSATVEEAIDRALSNQAVARLGVMIDRSQPAGTPVTGAVISDVQAGSPAQAAGLVAGDMVVGIAGQPLTSFDQIDNAVIAGQTGDAVTLDIMRGGDSGQAMSFTVTLAPTPTTP